MRLNRAEAFGESHLRFRWNALVSEHQDQVIEKRLTNLLKRCFAHRTG